MVVSTTTALATASTGAMSGGQSKPQRPGLGLRLLSPMYGTRCGNVWDLWTCRLHSISSQISSEKAASSTKSSHNKQTKQIQTTL